MKNIQKLFILAAIVFGLTSCGMANNQEAITMSNPPNDLETEESLRNKQLEAKENQDEQVEEEPVTDDHQTENTTIDEVVLEDEEVALELTNDEELFDLVLEQEVHGINVFNPIINSDAFVSLTYIGEFNSTYYYLHNYLKDNKTISSILATDSEFNELQNVKRLESSITVEDLELSDFIIDSVLYQETVFRYNLDDSYVVLDMNFEIIEEVQLPSSILALMSKDDFRHWDISNDFNMITYTMDESGLYLYYIEEDTLTHIGYNYAGSNDREGDFMDSPYFLMDDEYISTIRYIDERVTGHNIYNIKSNNFTILSNAVEESIYDRTGLYVYYLDGGIYGTYYDFDTDSRIERGISYEFELASKDDDLNILHKQFNLNNKFNSNNSRIEWKAFDLVTKEEQILFSYMDEEGQAFEVFANLSDKILLLAPFSIEGSRIIAIDL